MLRESVYTYDIKNPPGATVHALRKQKYDISMRQLADKCDPPLDHTTIRRLENNNGFTKHTLEKVAKALDVKESLLFYPPKVVEVFANLPPKLQEEVLALTEQEIIRITKKAIESLFHKTSNRVRRKHR